MKLNKCPLVFGALIFSTCCETSYNLQTEDAYTRYLPERLKTLTNYVVQQGIEQSIDWILHDSDLDSFLFILDVQKPYRMLAYSRQKQFFNKTAAEIQKELCLDFQAGGVSVALIFDQLFSTAQKGDTYMPYQWRFKCSNPIKYQAAHVHLQTIDEKQYVLGATLFVDYVPMSFIIEHRVKMVVNRIKKEGLEQVLPLLAHDPDPSMYFYIRQQGYPYRSIVNGGSDTYNLKTPEEMQQAVYPNCTQPEICDLNLRYHRFEGIAKRGGGYYAYLWPIGGTLELKVGYIYPIMYKKEHYIIASGFDLINAPNDLGQILVKRTEQMLKLIKEIGLDNAISAVHSEKESVRPIFIDEINPPYTIVLNIDRTFENKTAAEAQQLVNKTCHGKMCSDVLATIKEEAALAKDGGGFFAYMWPAGDEAHHTFLKVSFIKPFFYGGKNYVVGCGNLIK